MELSDLRGVGPARLARLRAMGINSLRDLLYFFPVRYEDHTQAVPISTLREGECMIRGQVSDRPKTAYFHGKSRTTALIRDDTGALSLCWFNEPWMTQQLPLGREIRLYGRVQVRNGRRSMLNPRLVDRSGWFPVYRTVKGVPSGTIHQLISEAVSGLDEICPETLSGSFRERYHLTDLRSAVINSHFPESLEQLREARRRLDFESMLIYMMWIRLLQQDVEPGFPMEILAGEPDEFWQRMPFPPTGAQKRVLEEISADLNGAQAMHRLVQGDVGCGKTVLAFGAIYLAWKHGFQAAMMAPTEILARQHYENAQRMLAPFGIRCFLLTGNTRAAERRQILRELKDGTCHALFGTHALISADVSYHRLGLVITDEQHRFGVRQRSRLQEKGKDNDSRSPHVLVMSATPIPRSMALILYGDLNLSLVDELPPGRKPVQTRIVPPEKREGMYRFLREKISLGQQAYIVCPLVEDSETLQDVKSTQSLFDELVSHELAGLRVGKTWGTQKNEEKVDTLHRFSTGELDVLVATTVIEVGVNVPRATVMIIENAERFGLSQLHQLRGRVGRGSDESWCFLLSSASEKLRILCETGDGFEVAQKDLELRGPGDLMGTRQSGEASLRMIGSGNVRLLEEVQRCVRELEGDSAMKGERGRIERLARDSLAGQHLRIARN